MAVATRSRLDWVAQPKQDEVFTTYAHVFELLYGGAAGPGKSEYLLAYNILRRLKYPGTSGLFLRREYQQLIKSEGAIPRSHQLLSGTGVHWNGSERVWVFPGGGRLEFGHIHGEEDKHNYQSAAYSDVQFDELTQFLESQYLYLFSRMRTTVPGCAPTVRSATNPGNVGHGWVKARFIDGKPAEQVGWFIRQNDVDTRSTPNHPNSKSRVFVPGRITDNPILLDANPDYLATLEALPEMDRRALLEGDWDAWQGMVFRRFSRDRHVLRPTELTNVSRRWCGLDWGTARPFVCLWLAQASRLSDDASPLAACDAPHVYVTRELSQPGLLDAEQAARVQALSRGETIRGYHADPNSFFLKSNATGVSPAGVFATYGLPLLPANNERLLGKRAVDAALGDCACGVPRLRIFETCVTLIEHLPQLPYDPHSVEDVDTDAQDDEYDALRYALMGPRPDTLTGRSVTLRRG